MPKKFDVFSIYFANKSIFYTRFNKLQYFCSFCNIVKYSCLINNNLILMLPQQYYNLIIKFVKQHNISCNYVFRHIIWLYL